MFSNLQETPHRYVFEVEDLATKDTSDETQKVTLYKGYSTDFIPLRPESDNGRTLPGPHVLPRYLGTMDFVPGEKYFYRISFFDESGELSLIAGLAAFSAPPDKMLEAMQKSVAGSQWTHHGLGSGSE